MTITVNTWQTTDKGISSIQGPETREIMCSTTESYRVFYRCTKVLYHDPDKVPESVFHCRNVPQDSTDLPRFLMNLTKRLTFSEYWVELNFRSK